MSYASSLAHSTESSWHEGCPRNATLLLTQFQGLHQGSNCLANTPSFSLTQSLLLPLTLITQSRLALLESKDQHLSLSTNYGFRRAIPQDRRKRVQSQMQPLLLLWLAWPFPGNLSAKEGGWSVGEEVLMSTSSSRTFSIFSQAHLAWFFQSFVFDSKADTNLVDEQLVSQLGIRRVPFHRFVLIRALDGHLLGDGHTPYRVGKLSHVRKSPWGHSTSHSSPAPYSFDPGLLLALTSLLHVNWSAGAILG